MVERNAGRGDGSARRTDDPRVLVVGDTVAGYALAALLGDRGIDPTLLTRRASPPATTGGVLLSSTARSVLADAGVDDPLDPHAVSPAAVAVDGRPPERSLSVGSGERGPLLVDRGRLRDRLREATAASIHRGREVVRIGTGPGRATVTFLDGERKVFDLVVAADGPNSFVRATTGVEQAEAPGLHEWEFAVDRPPSWPGTPRESWGDDAVATAVPLGDGLGVRVGVDADRAADPRDATLAGIGGAVGDLVGDRVPGTATYRRLPDPAGPATWRQGRVAFCGGAATGFGYLSTLAPSLGVEDAHVLAIALADCPAVDDALDAYRAARDDRLGSIREAAARTGDGDYPPIPDGSAIGRTAALRSVGLTRLLAGEDEPGTAGEFPGGDGSLSWPVEDAGDGDPPTW